MHHLQHTAGDSQSLASEDQAGKGPGGEFSIPCHLCYISIGSHFRMISHCFTPKLWVGKQTLTFEQGSLSFSRSAGPSCFFRHYHCSSVSPHSDFPRNFITILMSLFSLSTSSSPHSGFPRSYLTFSVQSRP